MTGQSAGSSARRLPSMLSPTMTSAGAVAKPGTARNRGERKSCLLYTSDGGKGVELFRSFHPELVLLDIMLPVMDGWSVLKTIRENDKTPVIMLTAKGETQDKVAGLEGGADD